MGISDLLELGVEFVAEFGDVLICVQHVLRFLDQADQHLVLGILELLRVLRVLDLHWLWHDCSFESVDCWLWLWLLDWHYHLAFLLLARLFTNLEFDRSLCLLGSSRRLACRLTCLD